MNDISPRCACGETDCDYLAFDYPYCRSCEVHHRAPECPVDEQGRALDMFGEPWPDDSEFVAWGEANNRLLALAERSRPRQT